MQNMVPKMVQKQRLVLMPHGPPVSEDDNLYMQLILWCGGDVGRVVDRPAGDVDRFIRYAERIRGVYDGTERALVMLTRTNPLALTVLDTRRRIERRLPALANARWVIYADLTVDPFFSQMAVRLGHLTDELNAAPHWIGPGNMRFLVLTEMTHDRALVEQGMRQLDEANLERSGVRRLS